jgi:hypothetical protein
MGEKVQLSWAKRTIKNAKSGWKFQIPNFQISEGRFKIPHLPIFMGNLKIKKSKIKNHKVILTTKIPHLAFSWGMRL